MRKYHVNENYFKTWTSTMSYILGFITADGYVGKDHIGIYVHPKDIEILEYIKNELNSDHPIDIDSRPSKINSAGVQSFARIRLFSKTMRDDVESLVCKNLPKTGNEIVPLSLPKEFKYDFIRGVFDGDGSVTTKSNNAINSTIYSSSLEFINSLKFLCDDIGVIKKYTIYQLCFGARETLILRDLMYRDHCFGLKRKKDILFSIEMDGIKKKKYLKRDDDLIKSIIKNGNAEEIQEAAKLLGRNIDKVRDRARKLGISIPKVRTQWTNYEINYLKNNIDLENLKFSIYSISYHINRSYRAIKEKIYELGLNHASY